MPDEFKILNPFSLPISKMYHAIDIENFLEKSSEIPVLDVRTPDEFRKGHIHGAINFPLFDNHERKTIGTIYKQSGRDTAIFKGLEFTGPKLKEFVIQAKKIARNNQLLIHCWRGGLRSSSLAWLFDTSGINTYTLKGGYKSFRRYVLDYFLKPFNLLVLGGMTGSGKTDVLRFIKGRGFQILDLEDLAHHKGSAFGSLGEVEQNTNEQFENDLFTELFKLKSDKTIWIEDESRHIGRNIIPSCLFHQISDASLICMDVSKQIRVVRLVRDYALFELSALKTSILKISRRLGGKATKLALEALENKNFQEVAEIMLDYYDKTYSFSLSKRDPYKVHHIELNSTDLSLLAENIIKYADTLHLLNKQK